MVRKIPGGVTGAEAFLGVNGGRRQVDSRAEFKDWLG